SILWAEQRARERSGVAYPRDLDNVELAAVENLTRYDVLALMGTLDAVCAAYGDIVRDETLDRHPWYGVHSPLLDYFGRERLVESIRGVAGALEQVARMLGELEA